MSSCKKTVENESKDIYNDPHKYYTVLEKNNNDIKRLFFKIKSEETSDNCRNLISTLKKKKYNTKSEHILQHKVKYG